MEYVTKAQIEFGQRVGLDLAGKSVGEAQATIEDVIQRDFLLDKDLGSPTSKQVELAAKFQRDISGASRRVGNAIIDDLMTELNHEAIRREKLAPGVRVTNKHDSSKKEYVVSSIKSDGTVYFRGGNGAKAWARSLVRSVE
ncbi:MAG: hypothetical protein ACRECF_07945 [Methyloceanibacter sp.]